VKTRFAWVVYEIINPFLVYANRRCRSHQGEKRFRMLQAAGGSNTYVGWTVGAGAEAFLTDKISPSAYRSTATRLQSKNLTSCGHPNVFVGLDDLRFASYRIEVLILSEPENTKKPGTSLIVVRAFGFYLAGLQQNPGDVQASAPASWIEVNAGCSLCSLAPVTRLLAVKNASRHATYRLAAPKTFPSSHVLCINAGLQAPLCLHSHQGRIPGRCPPGLQYSTRVPVDQ